MRFKKITSGRDPNPKYQKTSREMQQCVFYFVGVCTLVATGSENTRKIQVFRKHMKIQVGIQP